MERVNSFSPLRGGLLFPSFDYQLRIKLMLSLLPGTVLKIAVAYLRDTVDRKLKCRKMNRTEL